MSFFMRTKAEGAWGNNIQVTGEGDQLTLDATDFFTSGRDTGNNMAEALDALIASLDFELPMFSTTVINITALFPGASFNNFELSTNVPARIQTSGDYLTGGVDGELAVYTFNLLNEATIGDIVRFVKDDTVIFAIDPEGRITIDGEKAVETPAGEYVGWTGAGGTGAGAGLEITSGIITKMTPIA